MKIELTRDQIRTAFGEVLQLGHFAWAPATRPVGELLNEENFLQALTSKVNLLVQQTQTNLEQNAQRETKTP